MSGVPSNAVLAEAVETVKTSNWEVGDMVDCLDSVSKWCEARVMQVHEKKGYYINYSGWSEKWNEWIPKDSPRIAPYRSYTTRSTAPANNLNAFQLDSGDNLKKWRATRVKFSALLTKVVTRTEQLLAESTGAAAAAAAASQADPIFSDSDWAFLQTENLSSVTQSLNSVIQDPANVPEVATYLQDNIHMFVSVLKIEHAIQSSQDGNAAATPSSSSTSASNTNSIIRPVFFDVFAKVFNGELGGDKRFYSKYGVSVVADESINMKGKFAVRPPPSGQGDNLKVVSAYLVQFINFFGELGGFDLLSKKLNVEKDDNNTNVSPTSFNSLVELGHIACALHGMHEALEGSFWKKWLASLKLYDPKLSILAKVHQTTDEELKGVSKDVMKNMITRIYDLTLEIMKETKKFDDRTRDEMGERIQLELYLRLLKSEILEKRINGIVELQEMVKILRKPHPQERAHYRFLEPKVVIQWMDEVQLVALLLGADSHEEIVKRSPPILQFLSAYNALTPDHVSQLFSSATGKHEAFVRIVYDATAELAQALQDDMLEALYVKITDISPEKYTDYFLVFLKKFTLQAIKRNANSRKEYGLGIFWQLIQDESQEKISSDLADQCMVNIVELLSLPVFAAHRIQYVEKCMNHLGQDKSTLACIRLLKAILMIYPDHASANEWTKPTLLETMDQKLALTKTFFEDFKRYHKKATAAYQASSENKDMADASSTSSSSSTAAAASDLVVGTARHSIQLATRLEFLEFIVSHSRLNVTIDQINELWTICLQQAVAPTDRTRFYKWLDGLLEEFIVHSGSNQTNRRLFPCMTEETIRHVFSLLTDGTKQDMSSLTIEAYKCLESYFVNVNFHGKALASNNKKHIVVLDFDRFKGLDSLWEITSTATEKLTGVASRYFLTNLFIKLDARLTKTQRQDVTKVFYTACLKRILSYKEQVLASKKINPNLTGNNSLRILLQLVSTLEAFLKLQDNSYLPPADDKRPNTAPQVDLSQTYHRMILSNSPDFFNALFDVLQIGGEVANKIWALLNTLPTNAESLEKVTQLKSIVLPEGEANPNQPTVLDWSKIFPSDSIIQLLFLLQIATSHLSNNHESHVAEVQWWMNQFAHTGGLDYMYKLLTKEGGLFDIINSNQVFQDVLPQRCLISMFRLVERFCRLNEYHELSEGVVDFKLYTKTLLTTLYKIITVVPDAANASASSNSGLPVAAPAGAVSSSSKDPKVEDRKDDGELVLATFQSFHMTIQRHPELISLVYEFPHWPLLVSQGLLSHPIIGVRENMGHGIFWLCEVVKTQGEAVINSLGIKHPLQFFLPLLTQSLGSLDHHSRRSNSYFFLLQRLIILSGAQLEAYVPIQPFVDQIIALIKAHPIVEARAVDDDIVITGLFNVLKELLLVQPSLKDQLTFLVRHIHECLFTLPVKEETTLVVEEQSNTTTTSSVVAYTGRDHASISPPLCKSNNSRRSAFACLSQLVRQHESNFRVLVSLLQPLHFQSHSGGPDEWEFESKAEEKSECGYVGLRNLGCICYMNSTVQQLFMIPALRKKILEAAPLAPPENNADSVLYQLQYIMAFLQESEKQYVNPIGLCLSFKDFDGQAVNVAVQDDAGGFYSRLIDKINEQVKGTPHAALFQSTLGGTLCNQFIGRGQGCTHRRERDEEFFSIDVNVKNMKTLQDSLKNFVQGELLEGGNAFKCSECNAKVDTLKRTVFHKLPPTLVLSLKRFEMDYNTMRTNKLNDRLEFPNSLNVKPFTKEGIAELEALQAIAAGNEAAKAALNELDLHDDDYYTYELRGILVHSGSVDRGHYYSFVQERVSAEEEAKGVEGRWFELNDTVVRPFDARYIPEECYGGTEQRASYAGKEALEKQRSAYVLFYDRKQTTKKVQQDEADSKSADSNTLPNASSSSSSDVAPPRPSLERQRSALKVSPNRVPIPPAIHQDVLRQNISYWKDKFVFDPVYFDFLWDVINGALNHFSPLPIFHEIKSNDGDVTSLTDQLNDLSLSNNDDSYSPHTLATILATRFVLETLCRARHKSRLYDWRNLLLQAYQADVSACQWLLLTMSKNAFNTTVDVATIKKLLQTKSAPIVNQWSWDFLLYCPLVDVRSSVATLFCQVFDTLTASASAHGTAIAPAITVYIDSLIPLLARTPENWRKFNQFFRVLHHLSKLNAHVAKYLIEKHEIIARLVDIYLQDQSPLAADNPFQVGLDNKGKRYVMQEGPIKPEYTYFVSVLHRLITSSQVTNKAIIPQTKPQDIAQLIALSESTFNLSTSKPFLSRLLSEATTRRRGRLISEILAHHCWENMDMTKVIIGYLVTGIKLAQAEDIRPYFRCLAHFIHIPDSLLDQRLDITMNSLLLVMEQQGNYWKPTDISMDLLFRLSFTYPSVYGWLNSQPRKLDWLSQWLRQHPQPPRAGEAGMLLHKPNRTDPNIMQQAQIMAQFAAIEQQRIHFHSPYQGIPVNSKLQIIELIRQNKPITHNLLLVRSDSDEDLLDRHFEIGQHWDCLDTQSKWLVVRIVDITSDRIKVHYDGWAPKWDEWVDKDSNRIISLGRCSSGTITEKQFIPQANEGSDVLASPK